jgi:DNA-binding MarR family transcriptional regulator
MLDVDAQDVFEVTAADDQEPVEAFAAAGHARRIRDTDDRRRIYVELTEETRLNAGRY